MVTEMSSSLKTVRRAPNLEADGSPGVKVETKQNLEFGLTWTMLARVEAVRRRAMVNVEDNITYNDELITQYNDDKGVYSI